MFFEPFYRSIPSPVWVISDSQYAEYKRKEAEQDLLVLKSKLNRYNTAIEEIKVEIEKIQEAHGLLPASEDKEAAAA